jgi:nucleotide-binding universal stress UspA family protein
LPIAQELLETAAASEYDLLVCGGYGHSRMLETVFGGTTDYLLSHATMPIFLAH